MDVESAFDADIPVTPITSVDGIVQCLREVQLFSSEEELRRTVQMLREAKFGDAGRGELSVGVKKLLSMAEMARQDPDPSYKLVASLIREVN